MTLSQNGTTLATSTGVDAYPTLTAELPRTNGEFTLSLDQTRDGWAMPTSARVTTDWTFNSRRTHGSKPQDLPLNSLRIQPEALSGGNRTETGAATTAVTVRAEGGPRVRSLTAEVSFDDGKTWTTAPVTRNADGTWTATVTNVMGAADPANFATLRITAKDKEGGSVTQTVHSAYEIR